MSARSHVDVSERRLRPIYDCLDYGNNKKAIQEVDKVLKKQRDFPCAKALKGLALLRLGRLAEGTVLLQEVHTQSPTDEATLQAMVICYRELHRLDLIADMYANAHKAKPDSEDILTALFMSHVRLGDYKKQQQTAMALHRLKPAKNPYYFWAVMSIFMQAITDEKLGPTMFLPLAERMTQKYVKDDKIEAEAEVKMYLIILEKMKKYEVALEIINGPLGEKLSSDLDFAKTESARYYSLLERWPEANSAYRDLLLDEPDHWNFYSEYMNSFFKVLESNWVPKEDSSFENTVDHTVAKVMSFLSGQVDVASKAERPMRGPYLAQLEFSYRLLQCKISQQDTDVVSKPVDLLVQYYRLFGDKYCCFSDVSKYLTMLNPDERVELLSQVEAECPSCSDGSDETVTQSQGAKAMQRHHTLVQFSRYLGQHRKLDNTQRNKIIKDLLERYHKGLEFGRSLTATEFQYSDMYIIIISHILYTGWEETGDCTLIWQAIILLEKALDNSPSNFQIKLLLIRLYCAIGAFGPCTDLYGSLEIKHIQNDALGYVIANHVERLGHLNSAGILYDSMLRFFTLNHKETTEHLISSYKYGSFTQVQEFVKFRERLQNSMQYASATAERLLLDMTLEISSHARAEEILTYMDIDPEKDRTVWPDLRDNRDLRIMLSWDPPGSASSDVLHKNSFQEETAWLKIRNLTVRCLAAAIKLGLQSCPRQENVDQQENNVNNGDQSKHSMAEVLGQLADQLAQHIEFCRTVELPEYPMTGPFRTRLCSFLHLGTGQLFLDAIKCILYLHNLHEQGTASDTADNGVEEMMRSTLTSKLSDLIKLLKCPVITFEHDKPVFYPDTLENMVHITETIGFLTLLLGVCHRILKPMKTMRKNKKRKEVTTGTSSKPAVFASFEELVNGLLKCTDDLKSAVEETDPVALTEQMNTLSISDNDLLLENDADLRSIVWKKVEKSYHESAKDMEIYLDHKLKYLASLTL